MTSISARSVLLLLLVSGVAVARPSDTATKLIERLQMQKIPEEGAWFAATYRSDDVLPAGAISRYKAGPRVAGSAIYALITREDFSALHRLQTDETWHYYKGDPLELLLLHPDGRTEVVVLGPDVLNGQQPQYTVKRSVWQGARPLGSGRDSYTLFGCTLAPGFEYGDFEIGYRDELQRLYPRAAAQIEALTRSEFAKRPGTAMSVVTEVPLAPSKVFSPSDVKKIDVAPGTELRELIGRQAVIKTDLYSVALFTLAAGRSMPVSHNKTSEEVFLIASGDGEVTLGSEVARVEAGSTVVIKPTVAHSIKASPKGPLSFYAISVPAFSPEDYVITQ
ncbi:hypothetical protein HNQ60_004438 [Povalibacter uvarum]|uniref:Cupin domain-containing protein n=1 Tax=Povalibacter uvarum TaxID=732238 RepID=A0A841HU95_9GAMM|nr:cupin domain-containing protein [Povalibacter uvarum]MBB6095548.1 hypothetical protein [Povalibacter uvarum]